MSRRAATATTSTWRSPFSPVACPTTCQSSTACSSGIGMWSWAWKRIAVSSSRVVLDQRQAKRPHRHPLAGEPDPNGLRELVLGEQLLERVAERLGVGHLALAEDAGRQAGPCRTSRPPSRRWRRPRWPPRCRPPRRDPPLPCSWSSKACFASARGRRSATGTESTETCDPLKHASPEPNADRCLAVEEGVQVPVDDRVAEPEADDAAERQERPEGDRLLARRGAPGGRSATSPTRAPAAKPISTAGATARPR